MTVRKAGNSSSTQRRVEAEMRALGKRLIEIERRALKSGAALQSSTMRNMRDLQRQQAVVQRALEKFGRQSYAASGPIVTGLQKAWHDIELSVRQAA